MALLWLTKAAALKVPFCFEMMACAADSHSSSVKASEKFNLEEVQRISLKPSSRETLLALTWMNSSTSSVKLCFALTPPTLANRF